MSEFNFGGVFAKAITVGSQGCVDCCKAEIARKKTPRRLRPPVEQHIILGIQCAYRRPMDRLKPLVFRITAAANPSSRTKLAERRSSGNSRSSVRF
jgi:hypothetical protein